MKFYAVVALLVLLAIHNASADWRDDIKKTRQKKMSDFIFKEIQMILSNAVIKNTPSAWSCAYAANAQLTNLLPPYNQEIDKCVRTAGNENDANKCCDSADYNTISKAATITNNAMSC